MIMDILTQKQYTSFDYVNRYTGVPNFYNTEDLREQPGIGSNMKTNTDWIAHKVSQGDTLDRLALKYYNNPTLWWVIAYFNNIQDSFINLYSEYDIIKIPNISSIEFKNERV